MYLSEIYPRNAMDSSRIVSNPHSHLMSLYQNSMPPPTSSSRFLTPLSNCQTKGVRSLAFLSQPFTGSKNPYPLPGPKAHGEQMDCPFAVLPPANSSAGHGCERSNHLALEPKALTASTTKRSCPSLPADLANRGAAQVAPSVPLLSYEEGATCRE
jgi:hypothetical protein